MARLKKTKTQKINEMLDAGKTVAAIIKVTKASPSMVYTIRAKRRAKATPVTVTPNEVKPLEWVELHVEPTPTVWQRFCTWARGLVSWG